MNCPRCEQEIHSFNVTHDVQKLIHCPDGYEVISNNHGFPIIMPRTGRTEEAFIAGRANFRLIPCGCPVDRVECVSEGVFKFTGKDKDFRPVEFTGTPRNFTTSTAED